MSARAPDPEHTIDRAMALREAGCWGEAAGLLDAALRIHPRNPRLWQALGTVHRSAQRSALAIDAFKQAARLSPGDLKPAYGIAQASLEAGRAATPWFDAARRLAPGDGSLLIGRLAAQIAQGDSATAIPEFTAIVAANPLWLEGQATLARVCWARGDRVGFDAGYRDAANRHPRSEPLWLAWIDLLIHVERHAEAQAVLRDAEAVLGDSANLVRRAAICASERGEVERADALFARVPTADIAIVERRARHLLRHRRADGVEPLVGRWLDQPGAASLWPYLSLAWRVLDDARWAWLEGDPALVSDVVLDTVALDALASRLRRLHVAGLDPLGQSVRGGTQTDGPLFAREEDEIVALRSAIVAAVDRHLGAMGERDTAHPTRRHIGKRHRFAGSWSVRLNNAGHHSSHIHPQGWISSAFYVAVPDQATMGGTPAGWLELGVPPRELGLDLEPIRRIRPEPGKLVLFPSIMWHATAPIAGGERLTVAFDVAAID